MKPISETIRDRLENAGHRYNANDNIAYQDFALAA